MAEETKQPDIQPGSPAGNAGSTSGATTPSTSSEDISLDEVTGLGPEEEQAQDAPEPQPVVKTEAEWRGHTWEVTYNKVNGFNELKSTAEMEESTNDDKAGQSATKKLTRKLEEMSFSYLVSGYWGKDALEEYNELRKERGQHGEFKLNGKRYGPKSWQLLKVEAEHQLRDDGAILYTQISLEFREYAPEQSKKKSTTKSKSGKKTPGRKKSSSKKKNGGSRKKKSSSTKKKSNTNMCCCAGNCKSKGSSK